MEFPLLPASKFNSGTLIRAPFVPPAKLEEDCGPQRWIPCFEAVFLTPHFPGHVMFIVSVQDACLHTAIKIEHGLLPKQIRRDWGVKL